MPRELDERDIALDADAVSAALAVLDFLALMGANV
jgi:hypothetical protein